MTRTRSPALALALLAGVAALPAEAAFREQRSYQFRGPAESQVLLEQERLRLSVNGLAGGSGGGALGGGPITAESIESMLSGGTTVGNMANGTAMFSIEGSNNTITLDGFLNLVPSQSSSGQSTSTSNTLNR